MAKDFSGQLGPECTMTLQKAEYIAGEPININFSLTNTSNQTITVEVWAGLFDFWVCNDTDNNILYQWSSRILPLVMGSLTLNPRQSLTDTHTWEQNCNSTPFSEGIPVSLSTYYIVGQTEPADEIIETTPIEVIITS